MESARAEEDLPSAPTIAEAAGLYKLKLSNNFGVVAGRRNTVAGSVRNWSFGTEIMMPRFAIGLFFVAWLPALAQVGGLEPEWEARRMLAHLAVEAQRFKPILDQVNPQDWIAAGAPEAYVAQLKSTRNEVEYLVGTSKALAAQPEKLSLAGGAVRMQAIESFCDR
jgi:hypothetical protein